jgi:hypothetical protein
LFAARSAAVDSDAAGAAVAAGVAGVTANSGRVAALAVAGGTAWGVDSRTADGAGLTAGVPRISATRVHAAMAVSNPARGIPNRILFVITEIMVGTPYFMLPLEIQPGSTTGGGGLVAIYRNAPGAVKQRLDRPGNLFDCRLRRVQVGG